MKRSIFTVLLLAGLTAAAAQKVKVIDLSWSNPTVPFLQQNLAAMEKDSPLDGLSIRVRGKQVKWRGRTHFSGQLLWTDTKVEYKQFEKEIAVLKKLPFKKFTDNFYYSTTFYSAVDWYNDAQFKQIAANFGVVAKVCRAAGLKGILFDIEPYNRTGMWDYNKGKKKLDYRSARKLLFKRGQQWGKAVFSNYPDIVLFMPFMFSMPPSMENLVDPFLNGILSVMPPRARIVEGYEPFGYGATRPEHYDDIFLRYFRNADRKVAPENRARYLAQVDLGIAFYMDSIKRGKTEAKKECGGILNFMRRNFHGAVRSGTKYIWIYSETGAWWKNSPHRKAKKSWDEQFPGINLTIREALQPKFAFRKTNLLKNPDLKDKSGWYTWQWEEDFKKPIPGTVTLGGGKAVLKNVTSGCIAQEIPVKPGEYYLLQFRGINRSKGVAQAFVAFKNKNNKWLGSSRHYPVSLPDTGKMEEVTHLILIPENCWRLSIQLSAKCQPKNDKGAVIYTGAQLYKY